MTADRLAPNLISGLAAGTPAAYAALYDQFGAALLHFARAVLGSNDEAEDAVQDLFVELFRTRQRMTRVEDLQAYLFAVLRHTLKRRIARRESEARRLRQIILADEHKQEQPQKKETVDGLDAALAALPEEQREVIAMKIEVGLTFEQIGEILRVSSNTAASRYRYGLEKLRQALEEHRDE